jgi:hypothetical protein
LAQHLDSPKPPRFNTATFDARVEGEGQVPVGENRCKFFGTGMKSNLPRNRSTVQVGLDSSVTTTLTAMMGREPVGLEAAGLDPAALVLGLLGAVSPQPADFFAVDPFAFFPEAAKRKVAEDEGEDDDAEDEDDAADDEEEDEDEEEAEEDEDLDEEEEEEDDEDEEEEDDEFDDPDDDDDYDDDDDEDDFDDDE